MTEDRHLIRHFKRGSAAEKDGYWYIPVKSRELGGKVKDEQVPVKFYAFDGKRYGIAARWILCGKIFSCLICLSFIMRRV